MNKASTYQQRIFINGQLATKDDAYKHFIKSETYKNANRKTRDSILIIALNGDRNGNHNPNGEIEHLLEAGIQLAHSTPTALLTGGSE